MLHPTHSLSVLALAATAVAQVGWVQRNPATRPPVRASHSMTCDLARGVTVLFGGWNSVALGDTWEWNGIDWTQRVPATTPPARARNAIAFDIVRGRVVLFGGTSGFGDMNDTWEFDGNNWTQRQSTNQPSPRSDVCMAYDAARGRILLFGGRASGGIAPPFNDTWEWDGVAWTLRNPLTSPQPRWAHGMAYDFARARIVLFGGMANWLWNDTWLWDGANWSQLAGAAPTVSAWFGFAYDGNRDVAVRFGGFPSNAETWLLNDVEWRRDPRTATPPPRELCALAHDLVRSRTVLFGGHDNSPNQVFDDTWEYDPGVIAQWTTSGSGCPGVFGAPVLRPVGASLPILGTTFQIELLAMPGSTAAISIGFSDVQWSGGALPWNLGAIGMPGCMLHASPDVLFFPPVVAGRATLAMVLPNNPTLTGVRFFNQGFVLDPGINALGVTVSNAGAGIIGPF